MMGPVPMLALAGAREEGFDAGSFLQQEAVSRRGRMWFFMLRPMPVVRSSRPHGHRRCISEMVGGQGQWRRGIKTPSLPVLGRPAKQWPNACPRPWGQKILAVLVG